MALQVKVFDFDLIKNKRVVELEGEKMLDLTESTIEITTNLRITHPPIMVTKQFEGRPDLIAKAAYGDENYTDLLLFFNSISNPLSIQEGMILIVPDLDSMRNNLRDPASEEPENISKRKFKEKLHKKDQERIKDIKQKAKAGEEEIKAPNMVKDGDQETEAADGEITLGTNVTDTRCEDELSENQNLSEQIRKKVQEKVKQEFEGREETQVQTAPASGIVAENIQALGGGPEGGGGETTGGGGGVAQ